MFGKILVKKSCINQWPDLDEDLSTEGLLRGAPAPKICKVSSKTLKRTKTRSKTGV